MFSLVTDNQRPALDTLNALYEYDDFMASVGTVVDLGCGEGQDLEWWATRTTRDEIAQPLNIRCTGVDLSDQLLMAKKYPNITYQKTNFEEVVHVSKTKFDVLWCYDSFQYCVNPLQTLAKWRGITSDNGMMVVIVPQTTNFPGRPNDIVQPTGCYYHYTLVNLMHMLAVTGWDCKSGFFMKHPNSTWIHAIVYKSDVEPMDPRTTSWYDLVYKNLLPESAEKSIKAHGYLRQQDLVLPWVDKSLMYFGKS